MCATCGCGGSDHDHGHDHPHHPVRRMPGDLRPARTIRLEQRLLAKNDGVAARNRAFFAERRIAALNLMSSPGSGKTTLLEETLRRLAGRVPMTAIEGDQETERDAERLRKAGGRVLQINTGAVCHLDAEMIAGALKTLDPPSDSLLFIENVGNLVCPAMFDLGEETRVVLMSVTEGDDKPLKYPHMFRAASVLVLNKLDLLPHVDFDVERCVEEARRIQPELQVFRLSARRGDGLDAWCDWLAAKGTRKGAAASVVP